jgi:ribosomal protein L20
VKFGKSDKKRREYLKGFFKQHVKELKEAKSEILEKSGVMTKDDRRQLKEVLESLNRLVKVGRERGKGE